VLVLPCSPLLRSKTSSVPMIQILYTANGVGICYVIMMLQYLVSGFQCSIFQLPLSAIPESLLILWFFQ
jgi:hypothetical protein